MYGGDWPFALLAADSYTEIWHELRGSIDQLEAAIALGGALRHRPAGLPTDDSGSDDSYRAETGLILPEIGVGLPDGARPEGRGSLPLSSQSRWQLGCSVGYWRSTVASSMTRSFPLVNTKIPACPRQDSNLRTRLRRPMLYPLSYEGGERRLAARDGMEPGRRRP